MEEKILKQSEAEYFKSATNLIKGYIVMTDQRVIFYGSQSKMKFNHGTVGNLIRDKMEKAMGQDKDNEEFIFNIPKDEVSFGLKRFGFSKRLVVSDKSGNEYKLTIYNKKDRNSWVE